MRQTTLFTKTQKEAPKDEIARNAILLIRAGYIYKEMAGVYAYLPLGLRVLRNIERIIREEMDAAGAQELLLTSLQSPAVWEKTDRWSDTVIDNWFKTTLADGMEIGVANTHEEPLTSLLTHYANSYRDFPLYIYQIQTKFRNELRAKSGIMRGREFLMKDLYSFCRTEDEHAAFYARTKEAYTNVFRRSGIGEQTYFTYASGGSFSHASDEFQTVTDAGEDTIYVDPETRFSINEEMLGDEKNLEKFHIQKERLVAKKSVEVGNIFPLGTKFSEAFGLTYRDESGSEKPVIMGSYGIGLGRLMGTITEVCSDDKGLVWPEEVAPFQAHLVRLGEKTEIAEYADILYSELTQSGIEVLYDDRVSVSAGEKLADADLLGMPTRIVVSEKTLRAGTGEFRDRKSGEVTMVRRDKIVARLKE